MTYDPSQLPQDAPDPIARRQASPDEPSLNPYAPTSIASEFDGRELTGEDLTAEGIRRQYLKHEASVKSIGWLYIFPGVLLVGLALLMFFVVAVQVIVSEINIEDLVGALAILSVYGAFGGLQLHVGLGLRRLRFSARRWGIIFSTIGLVVFPVGTIINAYILYLLLSEKGKMIFSDDYKDVIRQTPHIRYRTSIIVIAFALILLLVIGFGVIGLFLG